MSATTLSHSPASPAGLAFLPTHRLARISPGSAARIVGALYAVVGVMMGPVLALPLVLLGQFSLTRLMVALAAPLAYGLLGYLLTGLSAWAYNLMARWLGGLEVTWRPATDGPDGE